MECGLCCLWDSLGDAQDGNGAFIRVAQLVWKVFIGYMESCAVMLDAEGRNSRTLEDTATTDFDLETLFFRTLFSWSQAWSFTHSNSFIDFKYSLNSVHNSL